MYPKKIKRTLVSNRFGNLYLFFFSGQPVVTLERDTTPEPDGLVQGHMSLDDLNAAGGSSEKSSSGSNEVLIPKNSNGPEVILQR